MRGFFPFGFAQGQNDRTFWASLLGATTSLRERLMGRGCGRREGAGYCRPICRTRDLLVVFMVLTLIAFSFGLLTIKTSHSQGWSNPKLNKSSRRDQQMST